MNTIRCMQPPAPSPLFWVTVPSQRCGVPVQLCWWLQAAAVLGLVILGVAYARHQHRVGSSLLGKRLPPGVGPATTLLITDIQVRQTLPSWAPALCIPSRSVQQWRSCASESGPVEVVPWGAPQRGVATDLVLGQILGIWPPFSTS
jgi:hypothetical protein